MTLDTYLTRSELITLTGYERFADMDRWLTEKQWPHEVNRNGMPVVHRAYHDKRMGVVADQHQEILPDFSFLVKAA